MQIAGYVEQMMWYETEYIDKVNFLVRILGRWVQIQPVYKTQNAIEVEQIRRENSSKIVGQQV
jgi:hypothetical protein